MKCTCWVPSVFQATMEMTSPRLLWAALLLPLVVSGVPAEEPTSGEVVDPSLPGGCRRCCDSEDGDSEDALAPADASVVAPPSALPYIVPEVRPYINITILKGESHEAGWGRRSPGTGRPPSLMTPVLVSSGDGKVGA